MAVLRLGGTEADAGGGQSPTRLAIGRLAAHRSGLVGLWICGIMVVLVVGVPCVWPIGPAETRPWLGARPPLTRTPDCAAENVFEVGKAPETTRRVAMLSGVEYRVRADRATPYRITLRQGKVFGIQTGAQSVPELDLGAGSGAWELGADGRPGRRLPGVRVKEGEVPPGGLFAAGARVLIVEQRLGGEEERVRIEMAGGLVRSIVRGLGAAAGSVPSVRVRGEDVLSVRDLAGRERTALSLFGTDELGRDLFVRTFSGGRVSLLVGLVATLVSLVFGVSYGAIAAYAGGRLERAMMGAVDVLYAVPFVFLVILLMVTFGRSIVLLFMALGAVQWLTLARIVRGQVLSLKEMPFVEAARLCGAGPLRVIFGHVVPHTVGPVTVYTTLTIPAVIVEESFLAFIGLQVQYGGSTLDSWGALISHGVQALGEHGEKGWLLLFPALAMVLTLFALNALGDGLRDCFDVKRGVRR